MRLSLVLVFCVSLKFTFSIINEKNKINKDEKMIRKTSGRMSRIKWHENGMDNLDNAMFNDNRMERAWYKKRNYNVQIHHKKNKNNPSTATATGKPINRKWKMKERTDDDTTKIELDKLTNQLDGEKKTRKIGKKISIGLSDLKRTYKIVPNIKERNQFYRRNTVEQNHLNVDFKQDIKANRQKKIPNKEKQPKTVAQNNKAQINTQKIDPIRPPINQNKTKLKHENLVQEAGQTMQKPITGVKVQKHAKKAYKNPNVQRNALNNDQLKTANNIDEGVEVVKTICRKSLRPPEKEKLQRKITESGSSMPEFPANTQKDARELKKVHTDDDSSIANELFSKVRILCWVVTYPEHHNITLKPIKSTWGRRCNKLLFISSELNNDEYVPTVKLNVPEGRFNLWEKNRAAFKYVYENYHDAYDWYVRTDDDTYMVIENLRYMLAYYNPSDPLFLGCRFKPYAVQGYMSGGAGVVLSRDALNKLGRGLNDSNLCDFDDPENDDVNLGKCLHRVGVKAVDSRDSLQKIRFLPLMPQDLVEPIQDKTFWYWRFVFYPTEPGMGCCSDYTISFHYVAPSDMYALEFLVYRVRPFGIRQGEAPLPPLISHTTQKNHVREQTTESPEIIFPTAKSSTVTSEEIARRLDVQVSVMPTEDNFKEEAAETSTQGEVTEKIAKTRKKAKKIKATTSIYHFINNNKRLKKTRTATTETATAETATTEPATTETATTEPATTEIATTETATTETATTETATTETVASETATTETAATETTTTGTTNTRSTSIFFEIDNNDVEGIAPRNDYKTNLDGGVLNMIDSDSIEIATALTTERVTTEGKQGRSTLPEFDEAFVSEEEFTNQHKIERLTTVGNRH